MPVSQDDVDAAALKPKKIEGKQGSVEQQPLADLQKVADKSRASTSAAKSHRGFRFSQVEHGGSR